MREQMDRRRSEQPAGPSRSPATPAESSTAAALERQRVHAEDQVVEDVDAAPPEEHQAKQHGAERQASARPAAAPTRSGSPRSACGSWAASFRRAVHPGRRVRCAWTGTSLKSIPDWVFKLAARRAVQPDHRLVAEAEPDGQEHQHDHDQEQSEWRHLRGAVAVQISPREPCRMQAQVGQGAPEPPVEVEQPVDSLGRQSLSER